MCGLATLPAWSAFYCTETSHVGSEPQFPHPQNGGNLPPGWVMGRRGTWGAGECQVWKLMEKGELGLAAGISRPPALPTGPLGQPRLNPEP